MRSTALLSFRRILAATLVLASVAVAPLAQASASIGAPAPDFSLVDSHGKTHALAELAGKVVVLEWTNHDCPFVGKHYDAGNMQALQRDYTDRGVVWLTVISSAPGTQGHVSPAEANELTRSRNAAPTAVLFDPEGTAGRAYGAVTTPHMYVVDAGGKLVYAGGIDSIRSVAQADVPKATPYVKLALDEVLAGKAVSTPSTRPYGCSIKYR